MERDCTIEKRKIDKKWSEQWMMMSQKRFLRNFNIRSHTSIVPILIYILAELHLLQLIF